MNTRRKFIVQSLGTIVATMAPTLTMDGVMPKLPLATARSEDIDECNLQVMLGIQANKVNRKALDDYIEKGLNNRWGYKWYGETYQAAMYLWHGIGFRGSRLGKNYTEQGNLWIPENHEEPEFEWGPNEMLQTIYNHPGCAPDSHEFLLLAETGGITLQNWINLVEDSIRINGQAELFKV